eukprot:gene24685-31056_t
MFASFCQRIGETVVKQLTRSTVVQHSLEKGNSVALVSDAGTPGISDPGAELAHALSLEDIPIHPIPGPSAVISALSISVKETFRDLMKMTHNFNEVSPQSTMYRMSERQVVCCRELTKMHEEVKRGSVQEVLSCLLETFKDKDDKGKGQSDKVIRGEFCIVLGPVGNDIGTGETHYAAHSSVESDSDASDINTNTTDTDTDTDSTIATNDTTKPTILTLEQRVSAHLTQLRSDGLDRKDAVQLVCDMLGAARSVVYNIGMQMKWERGVGVGSEEKEVKREEKKGRARK